MPPSKVGLMEHTKRAEFEAGWVSYQCKEIIDLPNPEFWGWNQIESKCFEPKWQDVDNPIDAEKVVTVTCSCIKAKSTSCQCRKQNVDCIN